MLMQFFHLTFPLLFFEPDSVIRVQQALVALRDRMHRHFPIFHSPSFRQSTFWPRQLIRRPTRLQLTAAHPPGGRKFICGRGAIFFAARRRLFVIVKDENSPAELSPGRLGAKSDPR